MTSDTKVRPQKWFVLLYFIGVTLHHHQVKINLYPYIEKIAILFVEICRKDGSFYESFDSR